MQWSMPGKSVNPALGAWLSSALGELAAAMGDIAVTFGPPGPDGGPPVQAGRAQQGINLHLWSIAPQPHATARIERELQSQLVLRYLATSWAEQRDTAESLLCLLAFHLVGRGAGGPDGESEILVGATPPPVELLAALGVPPRLALVVEVPLTYVETLPPARRVMHPPALLTEVAATLAGILLGPDEVPIASAQVELPAIGRITRTDPAGRFSFAGVPADPGGQAIRVRARGVERRFQLPAGDGGPLTLRMSFEQEA